MENSRIAGARRRLVVAKRFSAAVAAVAFGLTFVAIRSGAAATPNTAVKQTQTQAQTTTTQSEQSFFGDSNVGSASEAAPSVSSSTS
jgi:hypothetical protein